MKKVFITLTLLLLTGSPLFAHYLWIETNATGKSGKAQEIKVHFGEYTYGMIEEVAGDAFSNVNQFKLWVVAPDGTKTELETKAQKDHYLAYFTPKQAGRYTVLLNNNEIDVIDYTQYDFGIFKTHYHAVSSFTVGKADNDSSSMNPEGITVKRISAANDEVALQVLFKGVPMEGNELKIYISDLWSKTLTTDKEGIVRFKLPWKDTKYIVETTTKEEVPGTYKGEDYQFIWHCATYCIL
ncbi:DUF4198 domain-containing protein [Robertkochia solimangrovi]|uniref:DUF4198 domain-containing protein n=1 Tax=Robertkochia solimangrovi TaxID=2213046 RepID=UPI00117E1E88|nr:DUF4198 domain-containing protein [Robertkochia solimangrovi]TRZ41944.1 DUF4198 domain-containing protein [Robertkochia solimangrovi]